MLPACLHYEDGKRSNEERYLWCKLREKPNGFRWRSCNDSKVIGIAPRIFIDSRPHVFGGKIF